MKLPVPLIDLVDTELSQPVAAGAHALATRIRERYGRAVRGILMYGSCLRGADEYEGLIDLYVLVDNYGDTYDSRILSLLNRALPPNVFYLEAEVGGRRVRCKYAVLSMRDLAQGTSRHTFEPYFWARFSQPCALVYVADAAAREHIVNALAKAITTMVRRGIALVPPRFTPEQLWTTIWRQTYRCELRAERPGAVEGLWSYAADRYVRVTQLALPALPYRSQIEDHNGSAAMTVDLPHRIRRRAGLLWALRRVHGKARFLSRMLRNALIFEGAVDYALWKIQRHSGIQTGSAWREHRYPLLALGAHAWRLYRAGAFR